jgi:DNA mismatch endonuclease (patch repair protein)
MAVIPYPLPLDANVSKRMSRNPRRDTRPEREVRSHLHARGLRFRVDFPLHVGKVKVRPDIVFTRWMLATFIDGCFWHGCPEHGNTPNRNRDYWIPKLERNRARDLRVDAALREHGWTVIRAWEHEPVEGVVAQIVAAVNAGRSAAL